MITAADYAEWCRYAGLYLGNHSHAHCYKAYEAKISRAGLYVRVVDEFLQDNKGGIDIPSWRSYSVYEMGGDARYRLNLTADALQAIGATRAAVKVRTAEDTSASALLMQNLGDFEGFMQAMQQGGAAQMMEDLQKNIARAMPDEAASMGLPVPGDEPVPVDADCETWEEIEHLLSQYVASHQTILQQDYATHGDPRQEPGFDPETRMAELDAIHAADVQAEIETEDAEKLQEHLRAFEKTLRGKGSRKASSWRRKILAIYRKYASRPTLELTPPLRSAIAEARRVMDQHSELFFPAAIDDEELTQRLAAIGDYQCDPAGNVMEVNWPAPPALNSPLGQFGLCLSFPAGDRDHLQRRLARIDKLIARFPQYLQQIRQAVLESFKNAREYHGEWLFEDYERDAAGNIAEETILAHTSPGRFNVHAPEWDPEENICAELDMGLDWDDEHGLQMEFGETPDEWGVT